MPPVTIRACRADEGKAVLDAWKLSGTLPTVSDDLESVQRCLEAVLGFAHSPNDARFYINLD